MKFLQRIKDGAGKVTDKAQNAVEIGRLNTQIHNIEREMDLYFQRMGEVFYEGYRVKDMSQAEKEMIDLAKTCDLLAEERDEVRLKIAELKNERLCVSCGKAVTDEALFCQYCGHKLEKESKPAPVKAETPEQREDEEPLAWAEENVLFASPAQEEPPQEEPVQRIGPEEEARLLRELERERKRQEELDRRIRTWKENVKPADDAEVTETLSADETNCQICSAQLVKGTKWCPHCGSEQI
ncbi:zinc-ribbon domain-containing protein [Paenibacillus fonticola]|uniref:zinc-ribbon domain-containing protein n=1 Tax=Paenibacillus fonticola TaxID=379896 RepID=UPI0003724A5B|nr:zinc ribbon domain-containing protein [Paenibacillus fonticola]